MKNYAVSVVIRARTTISVRSEYPKESQEVYNKMKRQLEDLKSNIKSGSYGISSVSGDIDSSKIVDLEDSDMISMECED
jgi:hypothetical protein